MENRDALIQALQSGSYKHARDSVLTQFNDDPANRHCALGELLRVFDGTAAVPLTRRQRLSLRVREAIALKIAPSLAPYDYED